jgi:hypothetical protein
MINKAVYIATKPQEYITCRTIAEGKSSEEQTFVLVKLFQAAQVVAENIKAFDKLWVQIEVFDLYVQALDFAATVKADILYIDCDVGYMRFIQLLKLKKSLPEIKIYIYEEGIGVNRDDYKLGFKRAIFKILGIGINFGGSRFTEGIFIYSEKNYRTKDKVVPKEVVEIHEKYYSYITRNIELLSKIFELIEVGIALDRFQKNAGEIAIFLSDWEVNVNFSKVEFLRIKHPNLLIKMHPRSSENLRGIVGLKIPAFIPAELIIVLARARDFTIYVYSTHKSTVEYYLQDIERIDGVHFCKI